MKTFRLKIIILAFGTVFLSSCTTLMYTSLDVLRPAKIAFAPNANNLLIVNNSITQPADYGHKIQLLNEKTKKILLPTDSLSIFCLGALKEELDGKNFFSTVQLLPDTRNSGTDFNKINRLNADTIRNLCISQQADVVLSLDRIKVNDELIEYYINETSTYLSTLDVKFETYWSIHYPNKPQTASIQFKDTIYWESESYYRKKAMGDLPKRSDALIDGALNVGQKSVKRFVPYWEKVDRYFFNSNNRYIKLGMDSVYVKNWTAAIGYWEKVDRYFFNSNNRYIKLGMDSVYVKNWTAAIGYWVKAVEKSKNTRIKAQAQNNIAIAYEILGDIDKALYYATKSYYSFTELSIVDLDSCNRLVDYLYELDQRQNDIALLKKQLGESSK